MLGDDDAPFPYMRWAKRHLTGYAPANLGMSGIPAVSTPDLPMPRDAAYWAPEGEYGNPELRGLIAARYAVPADRVFVSARASSRFARAPRASARRSAFAASVPTSFTNFRATYARISSGASTQTQSPSRAMTGRTPPAAGWSRNAG